MFTPLDQCFNNIEIKKVLKNASLSNKESNGKPNHVAAEFNHLQIENSLSPNQQNVKLHSYQLQLQMLKDENATLKTKVKDLPCTQEDNTQKTLKCPTIAT
ncbi:hypothetical protein ZYGM_003968 [Zygosaccharomyces mellis]|uniref:Uncharacterized protein n=1 Tax=Zygosaccharomyces mellis TaxID=42258 RepID=A0A4C2E9H8_9SACH|nr:hypothetical protein ZYGM_003968 [Zygosaccharomyces mellis]